MKTITKIIAFGAVGAAGVVGTVAAVRALRARRAEQELEIRDLGELEDEPIVVAEEVIIISDATDADLGEGFTP